MTLPCYRYRICCDAAMLPLLLPPLHFRHFCCDVTATDTAATLPPPILLCYHYRCYASTASVVMLPCYRYYYRCCASAASLAILPCYRNCYRRCTSATSVAMLLLPLLPLLCFRRHICGNATAAVTLFPPLMLATLLIL